MENEYRIKRNGRLNDCSIFDIFLTVECFDLETCYLSYTFLNEW